MDNYSDVVNIYDNYFTGVEGDVEYYVSESKRLRGPILELGCGTGRITLALAKSGVRVTGIDNSPAMLNIAREKLSKLGSDEQRRVKLVQGDMRNFEVTDRFSLVIAPYRAYMHLLTPHDQVQTLLTVRNHLRNHGRLILNLFDPSYEWATGSGNSSSLHFDTSFQHPLTGRRVMAWYIRQYDVVEQLIHQQMLYDEIDETGAVVGRSTGTLTLRYSHRYELHYLLELCGYTVEALYGDFRNGEYSGGEQIWVARKTDAN